MYSSKWVHVAQTCWILKALVVAILVLYLTSCANNQHSEVGEFVYVDCFNTIHTDRDCVANLVDNPKTNDERMADMQGIQFVDTCNLSFDGWRKVGVKRPCPYQFCSKCVDDNAFRHINAIMERNEVKPLAY